MAAFAAVVAATVLVSCDPGEPPFLGCGPELRESLAADAGVHVIASAPVDYASTPPTSGPHAPGPELGVYARTLTPPEQVGVLERGDIVVQYDPLAIIASEIEQLEATFGPVAVVFPSPDLDDAVVLTAWRVRSSCNAFAPGDVQQFISDHRGNGAPHEAE